MGKNFPRMCNNVFSKIFIQTEKELKKQKKEEKKAAAEAAKANGGTTSGGNGSAHNTGAGLHPLCSIGTFTTGINLLDRDERSINEHVNVNFEDVLGEPDATQGFEGAYRLSYGVFQFIRFWVYRILMAVISIPLALVWGVVFALLSVFSVWVLTPAFRIVEVAFYFFHRVSVEVFCSLSPFYIIHLSLVMECYRAHFPRPRLQLDCFGALFGLSLPPLTCADLLWSCGSRGCWLLLWPIPKGGHRRFRR